MKYAALLVLAAFTAPPTLAQAIREVAPGVTRIDAPLGISGNFGQATAMRGALAVVGAPTESSGGATSNGAAYLYRYDGGAWRAEARLVPWGDSLSESRFGTTMDIGVVGGVERVVVGASSISASDGRPGAVYVFRRATSGAWEPDTLLRGQWNVVGDRFGVSVSMDGARLAVGEYGGNGAVYVFDHDGGAWHRSARVEGDSDFDVFGYHVSLSGDRIAMTTRTMLSFEPGRAFVLARTERGWAVEQTISRLFGFNYDRNLACWIGGGDVLCLPFDWDSRTKRPLVLRRGASGWARGQELTDPAIPTTLEPGIGSRLLDSGTLVVPGGRPQDSNATRSAPTAVYRRGPERWERTALLEVPPQENVVDDPRSVAVGLGGRVVFMSYNRSPARMYAFDLDRVVSVESAEVPPKAASLRIAPNPARGHASVGYTLTKPGAATLRVFDVTGRETLRQHEGSRPPGAHLMALDVSGLASGVYVVRVETPGGFSTGKLVRLP